MAAASPLALRAFSGSFTRLRARNAASVITFSCDSSPSVTGFRAAGHFIVNVLRATQADLSHRFATRRDNKFEGIDFDAGLGGAPVLRDMLATFECETASVIEGGDHLLFIGHVHRMAYDDGDPLIFNAGKYCTAQGLPAGTAVDDLKKVWGPPGD